MKDTRQKKERKLSLANSQNSLGTIEWHVNCVGEPRKLKASAQKNMYSHWETQTLQFLSV